ncbi:hypothetical protein AAZX31_07G099800 [Glycine max]|nr:hypothetical protein GLYMA_07G104750v4 [Glycine max]KAH1086265.1 hypothetical protein GYH30_017987 [Glycine max]
MGFLYFLLRLFCLLLMLFHPSIAARYKFPSPPPPPQACCPKHRPDVDASP